MARRRSAHELVEEASYRNVKHASYLKGLLKPFKGKGGLREFEEQLLATQEGLAAMMDEVVDMWARPPFSLLPIDTKPQPSTSGASHLRWRSRGRGTRMGVGVWSKEMLSHRTPDELLEEMYWFEVLRIRFNMQMTCVQFMIRQARECQEKMQDAEDVYAKAKSSRVRQ